MHPELDDDLQKLIQAGIGALAIGAEKSEEVLKTFVKKGESILCPTAIRNEELKHRRKEEPEKTDKAPFKPVPKQSCQEKQEPLKREVPGGKKDAGTE